jgi:hypothetical protein
MHSTEHIANLRRINQAFKPHCQAPILPLATSKAAPYTSRVAKLQVFQQQSLLKLNGKPVRRISGKAGAAPATVIE